MKQLKKNHTTKNHILYTIEKQKDNLETLQAWCQFQGLGGGDLAAWWRRLNLGMKIDFLKMFTQI